MHACAAFADESSGGQLTWIERTLRNGAPYLFIVDGLDRIQSDGRRERGLGQLIEHQLRILLRCIAEGAGRNTSFRHKPVPVDGSRALDNQRVCDSPSGRKLRGCGPVSMGNFRSADKQVRALADKRDLAGKMECHALSLAIVGSYLRETASGDPDKTPQCNEPAKSSATVTRPGEVLPPSPQLCPRRNKIF